MVPFDSRGSVRIDITYNLNFSSQGPILYALAQSGKKESPVTTLCPNIYMLLSFNLVVVQAQPHPCRYLSLCALINRLISNKADHSSSDCFTGFNLTQLFLTGGNHQPTFFGRPMFARVQ